MPETVQFESDVDAVRPIASLSLFYIAFLVTQYLFDGRAAAFLPAGGVALLEAAIVGVSIVGFLLYALVRTRISGATSLLYASGGLSALGLLFCALASGGASLYVAGVLTMLVLGFSGAAAHEALARRFADGSDVARVVGAAYGADLDVSEPSVLRESLGRRAALLAILVALMTCVFSTLNVNLTSAHAAGLIDLGEWTRLFLAVSAAAAGEVLDRLERRWEPVLMACVTTLASFAIFALLMGAPLVLATVVFYLGSGFFVVFFTSSFMLMARETGRYALWSGMGRAVNSVASLLVAAPALTLVGDGRALAETGVILSILAAMLAVTFLLTLGPAPEPALPLMDDEPEMPPFLSADNRLEAFALAFGLTAREAEVLEAMVSSRQSVQELVRGLGISRTAFYRHVSSMAEKTGTESRVELMHFYFDWQPGTSDNP